MQSYYVIIQDTLEVIDIGEYESTLSAEKYVEQYKDNLTHGYRYIVAGKDACKTLMNNLFKI